MEIFEERMLCFKGPCFQGVIRDTGRGRKEREWILIEDFLVHVM